MFTAINTTVKQAQRMIAVAFARPVFNIAPQHNDDSTASLEISQK
jgi:hypothetical protein